MGIQEIPDGIFQSLHNLSSLSFDNNRIHRLNSNSFRGLSRLETISATNSGVYEIEPNFFDHFPSLFIIFFRENECISRDFWSFGNISNVIPYFEGCFANWVETASQGSENVMSSVILLLLCWIFAFIM